MRCRLSRTGQRIPAQSRVAQEDRGCERPERQHHGHGRPRHEFDDEHRELLDDRLAEPVDPGSGLVADQFGHGAGDDDVPVGLDVDHVEAERLRPTSAVYQCGLPRQVPAHCDGQQREQRETRDEPAVRVEEVSTRRLPFGRARSHFRYLPGVESGSGVVVGCTIRSLRDRQWKN